MSRQTELQQAVKRAEQAEAELAKLKAEKESTKGEQRSSDGDGSVDASSSDGEAELRNDSVMCHLLDSLEAGKDIGHYGRLVFAMVARHFLPQEQLLSWLTRDPDFSEEQAEAMLAQVEGRDYNPPKRERLLEWQSQQEFPILPNADDPDCGNFYRNLKFPHSIYHHIEQYQEEKIKAS